MATNTSMLMPACSANTKYENEMDEMSMYRDNVRFMRVLSVAGLFGMTMS